MRLVTLYFHGGSLILPAADIVSILVARFCATAHMPIVVED